MRSIWLVTRHEIATMLQKRSFWLFTFLVPGLLLALNVFYVLREGAPAGQAAQETEGGGRSTMAQVGLVDDAGLVAEIPAAVPSGMLVRFPDAASARAALEAGRIEQYVHVPADYVARGEVTIYDRNFQILRSGQGMGVAFGSEYDWVLAYVLNANLGDEQLAVALRDPVPGSLAHRHALNPPVEAGEGNPLLAEAMSRVIPYIVYFVLIIGSGLMLQSVTAEKENRTAEVLLLSLHPRELMSGKILGLGAVTLLQAAVWVGGGALILDWGTGRLNVPAFTFPPGFLAWMALFLLFAFVLYASIMAAAGALSPTSREGTQVTFLLVMLMMPALLFSSAFLHEPHGALALALSLFPFTAPSAILTRLAVADVPLWQPVVSLLGLAGTTWLAVLLAARLFRPDNLLSQASFSWRRVAAGWRALDKE
jgi:ABC-2 type transport system permease protein